VVRGVFNLVATLGAFLRRVRKTAATAANIEFNRSSGVTNRLEDGVGQKFNW